MISEEIRNVRVFTFDDVLTALEEAAGALPEPYSMTQIVNGFSGALASALAVAASAVSLEENAPPWAKADHAKISSTAV